MDAKLKKNHDYMKFETTRQLLRFECLESYPSMKRIFFYQVSIRMHVQQHLVSILAGGHPRNQATYQSLVISKGTQRPTSRCQIQDQQDGF